MSSSVGLPDADFDVLHALLFEVFTFPRVDVLLSIGLLVDVLQLGRQRLRLDSVDEVGFLRLHHFDRGTVLAVSHGHDIVHLETFVMRLRQLRLSLADLMVLQMLLKRYA